MGLFASSTISTAPQNKMVLRISGHGHDYDGLYIDLMFYSTSVLQPLVELLVMYPVVSSCIQITYIYIHILIVYTIVIP